MDYTRDDLNTCDLEQVHLIGSIQPIGCLIVADVASGRITHLSENVETELGWPLDTLLDAPLAVLLGEAGQQDLMHEAVRLPGDMLVQPRTTYLKHPDGGEDTRVTHLTHLAADHLYLEIFLNDISGRRPDNQYEMRQHAINALRTLDSVEDFSETAVRVLRATTGYARVMCYKFHSDGHGEVIAEDTDLENRYLGLHYPATDIPQPARRQFSLNKVRIIANVQDVPVGIRAADRGAGQLDLSFSKLRAVSPIHLKYLSNMGVDATLVLPLMVEEQLWGLLVCHHDGPKSLSAIELHAAELTAQVVELFFESIIRTERDRWVIKAQELAFDLSKPGSANVDLAEIAESLGTRFQLDAVAARINDQWLPLWNWSGGEADFRKLHQACADGVFVTDKLSDFMDLPEDVARQVSGCAFLSIDADRDEYFVLARQEFRRNVAWAGAPTKPTGYDTEGRPILEPRASFGRWSEQVLGKCRPFSANDTLAFGVIVQSLRALIASRRAISLTTAKRELEEMQSELRNQLLNTARSASLGELAAAIAHELNQPLTSISNFVSASRILLSNDETSERGRVIDLMDNAVSEAQRAGQIVHHLRNLMRPGFERRVDFDVKTMLEQAARLALTSSKQGGVELDLDISDTLPMIYGDKVQLEQVVFNLVRNAVEAMEGHPDRKLTVSADLKSPHLLQVIVEDTGPGIAPEFVPTLFEAFRTSKAGGMGIGLSLCRSTVEAHNGQIWGENTGTGARFGFTIPTSGKESSDER
ncbi:ATP-binding protein [Litoreibacter roseus]|nr:ATP-binding protein [Litoreibacter roseus]